MDEQPTTEPTTEQLIETQAEEPSENTPEPPVVGTVAEEALSTPVAEEDAPTGTPPSSW